LEAEPAGPVVAFGAAVGEPFGLPVMPVLLEPPPELAEPVALPVVCVPPVAMPGLVVVVCPDGPVVVWATLAPVIARARVAASAAIFNMWFLLVGVPDQSQARRRVPRTLANPSDKSPLPR
jgi:hypothetical protein